MERNHMNNSKEMHNKNLKELNRGSGTEKSISRIVILVTLVMFLVVGSGMLAYEYGKVQGRIAAKRDKYQLKIQNELSNQPLQETLQTN